MSCQPGYSFDEDKIACVSVCAAGRIFDDGDCKCPTGTFDDGENCVHCDKPMYWDAERKACMSCGENAYYNEMQKTCLACPAGTKLNEELACVSICPGDT